ncbi:hypothetical protein AGROH133_14830 (plasmid) [Agrobacterium tumefaciens]|nr:hypothetical protein AGROH133_14830 [Agrobacterium tumefaciens]
MPGANSCDRDIGVRFLATRHENCGANLAACAMALPAFGKKQS